jgi:tetratricopeptide (TPR) repeat protein
MMSGRLLLMFLFFRFTFAFGRQTIEPVTLFEQGQFDRAKKSFEAIVQAQPMNATAHYFLGRLLLKEQFLEADSAVEHLEKCTILEPMNAEF